MTSTDDHPPPFVCGMGLLGISVPLTLTAAQTACVRASSLRTLSEFTIRAVSSNLPSWSDSRPSKFLRRRLKVIKRWKAESFSFWPGPLSSLAGSHLLSSFCLQSSLHCGVLVTTSDGQSVGTSVQRLPIGFAYETNLTLDIKWPNSTEIVCSRGVNKNVKEITQKFKFCPFV